MTRLLRNSICRLIPLILSTACFLCQTLYAQDNNVAGNWKGAIEIPGQRLEIEVELKPSGSWSGTYDIPVQGISAFPLEKISVAPPAVSFILGGGIPGEPTFKLQLSEDGSELTGSFMQSGMTFPARLKRATATSKADDSANAATTLEEIRTFLSEAQKNWDIPGLAVAIVKDDRIVFAEGFGERDVEKNLPVTPSTLFAIGSTTKAFTSVVIGTLVDEGLLKWDEPVKTYLPDFQLKDEYATNHLTVRDLLLHVSGLPRHDLLWYGSDFNRQELFKRLRFLEPTAPLRGRWQYQNLMYMTAGVLAERVGYRPWEDLVRDRIFRPLGMKEATLSVADMQRTKDFSQPYGDGDSSNIRVDFRSLDAIGPAGAINASVEEMAAWLRMNLNKGEFEGKRIISEESLSEIHSPAVVISGETGVEGVLFNLYAMGWMVSAYRGHRLLHHGGGIDGFVSHVAILPDDGIGVVVLTNRPTGLPEIAMLDIVDRMLGLEPTNHTLSMLSQVESMKAAAGEEGAEDDIGRVKGTKPAYPFAEYEGDYEHPAYGIVRILREGETLSSVFHRDTVRLEHYHYDVFRSKSDDGETGGLLVSFQPDIRGGISGFTVLLEPTVAPILFEKRTPQRLSDPEYLNRFTGSYKLSTQEVTVGIRDTLLTVSLPGQPLYTLISYKDDPGTFAEFTIDGLKGFFVRFEEAKGKVGRLIFIQPNGTFVAERK